MTQPYPTKSSLRLRSCDMRHVLIESGEQVLPGTRVTLINLMIDPRAKHALHTTSAPRKSGERDRVRKLTKLLLSMTCMYRCFNGPQGGAVYVDTSVTFTATNCEFSSNTAVASVVMPYLDLLLFRTCIAADLIESQRRSCVIRSTC